MNLNILFDLNWLHFIGTKDREIAGESDIRRPLFYQMVILPMGTL